MATPADSLTLGLLPEQRLNRRAIAAKQYLSGRGIDAGRITTKSMGEEQPVDPGHNEEAWAAQADAGSNSGDRGEADGSTGNSST